MNAMAYTDLQARQLLANIPTVCGDTRQLPAEIMGAVSDVTAVKYGACLECPFNVTQNVQMLVALIATYIA